MDKEFWVEIYKNQYEIPAGHTLVELTREIFSYLGSTDPELRDEIGYTFFANWLKRELYTADEIRGFIKELLANLENGIGETGGDSVEHVAGTHRVRRCPCLPREVWPSWRGCHRRI